MQLYSDRKPRVCRKLGNGPRQHKICKCPTPATDKVGKCPAVARGGGGRGGWVQLELTDALLTSISGLFGFRFCLGGSGPPHDLLPRSDTAVLEANPSMFL